MSYHPCGDTVEIIGVISVWLVLVMSGGGQAAMQGMSNLMAQYYHDSALRMGLVDMSSGICFADQVVHNHLWCSYN